MYIHIRLAHLVYAYTYRKAQWLQSAALTKIHQGACNAWL